MTQNTEQESDTVRNEEQLTEVFAEAGAKHGFDNVRAGFSAFKTFKLKWLRNQTWAEFEVTDYLREAPRDVMFDIADVIIRKIRGEAAEYSARTVEYLNSNAFLDATRGIFLKRLNGFTAEYTGEEHPLRECVERLVEKGLVEDDPKLVIGWVDGMGGRAGGASTLMHVVGVNPRLAADDTDEELLDYVVYSLLLRVRTGFPTGEPAAWSICQDALAGYPGREELEQKLSDAGLRISVGPL